MEQKKQKNLSNKNKQCNHTTIAVVVDVIIGAMVKHFLSLPECWIRL